MDVMSVRAIRVLRISIRNGSHDFFFHFPPFTSFVEEGGKEDGSESRQVDIPGHRRSRQEYVHDFEFSVGMVLDVTSDGVKRCRVNT